MFWNISHDWLVSFEPWKGLEGNSVHVFTKMGLCKFMKAFHNYYGSSIM